MIILLTGASHSGKTLMAQRLLEKYHYPYLSLDHLKMGLIRSGYTSLTPMSDDRELAEYLWPVAREMIKTAIENGQNLTVEGCYIPFDWEKDFSGEYRREIRFFCLVMSEQYILSNFEKIKGYANAIERRLDDSQCTLQSVLEDNRQMLARATQTGARCVYTDGNYDADSLSLT